VICHVFSQLGSSFEKSERTSTIFSTPEGDTSKKYMSKNMGCNILVVGLISLKNRVHFIQ
jgi:hypothetical protein